MNNTSIQQTKDSSTFLHTLSNRLLLLDGGMGTMLQKEIGLNDATESINVTAPELVKKVHRAYLQAGADIITANTFSTHRVSLSEYGLSEMAEDLAFAGAKLAREVVDEYVRDGKKRFVAGSMGPTNRSLTLDPEGVCPTFEFMAGAYREQARGLIRGGVDVLLIETIFDLMNAKAAVEGAKKAMKDCNKKVDLWLSFTIADRNGHTLTGYSLEDCVKVMHYAHPSVISLNCGFGPQAMVPFIERLASVYDGYIGIYPNAGLPDAEGNYNLNAKDFCHQLQPLLNLGVLNVVGGCCGTTDEHISALYQSITLNESCQKGRHQGGHNSELGKEQSKSDFVIVGERCNVAGSKIFSRIVVEGHYDEAVKLALRQLDEGASIIDINVDSGILDGPSEMVRILDAFSSEPSLLPVPLMIDSSNWQVVETALNRVPSKLIVNSISLKDGESIFLQKARIIAAYGAGLVVMAADERGQATNYERRIEVCLRAYKLLRKELDFPAEDIIFDPNVLAICTGREEDAQGAADLLKTIKTLHKMFPTSHIIGGVSNLSFAFRGCTPLRNALHSVFLQHARNAGMDMFILNPGSQVDYNTIPIPLKELLEDAIINAREVSQELIKWSNQLKETLPSKSPQLQKNETMSIEERLNKAIFKGESQMIEELIQAMLLKYTPFEIISGPLMESMEKVGEQFSNNKLFLPQVVRAAEVMNRVVELLRPLMGDEKKGGSKGKFLFATVKGDVHDIGKNICATLLRCNGFEVIDLGVMVELDVIVETALRLNPSFIGLSGLIAPSLLEMKRVISACQQAGLKIPIFIGGATTSAEHTALHLANAGEMPILWTEDATQLVILANKLYELEENTISYNDCILQIREQQKKIRMDVENVSPVLSSIEEAQLQRVNLYGMTPQSY